MVKKKGRNFRERLVHVFVGSLERGKHKIFEDLKLPVQRLTMTLVDFIDLIIQKKDFIDRLG